MKDVQVFKRGQVWYVDDNSKSSGSIQAKSRPYVVVSNDMCNMYSPVIHMAPITSQDKGTQPTHVAVYDPYRKIEQTVLLEQVMPKSVPDIVGKSTYRYTLTDVKMKEIDKALAIQLGLTLSDVSLDDFEELLNMMVESKLAAARESLDKVTTERADKYINKMLETIDNFDKTVDYNVTKFECNPIPKVEIVETPCEKKVDVGVPVESESPKSKKGSRSKWTDELKRQFLDDLNDPKMKPEDIQEKYGIGITTIPALKCKFRRELGITTPLTGKRGRPKVCPENSKDIKLSYEERRKSQKENHPEELSYLDYYNTHAISEVVNKYNLRDKEAAVERANYCRLLLGE